MSTWVKKYNWVERYKSKVRKMRWAGFALLLATIFSYVLFFVAIGNGYVGDDTWYIPVLLVVIPWLVVFPASVLMLCTKVVHRKYNGSHICFYVAPIKNYLIIDDEIQYEGGPGTHYYYGQLPDGTDVAVKVTIWGDVKFAMGSTNNIGISFF